MIAAFDTQQLLNQLRSLDPFSTGPRNADGLVVLPYEERTMLFKTLEYEKWDEAILRAKSNPEEAQAWQEKVVNKDKSIKRCLLPLHAALNLDAPREVILAVLEAYPGALQCQDDHGQLPLHLAMKKEVFDLELVDAFLLVYPNGCKVKDHKGHIAVSLHDRNPTQLFRYIESKEWNNAVYQTGSYPYEATVWTFRREDDSKKLRWTLSPLHAAIIYSAPTKVVKAILDAFPEAASKKDDEGMLPLHLAFRSSASAGVMEALLESFPEGIRSIDRRGYVPLAHCQTIKGENKGVLESYANATFKLEHDALVDTSKKDREDEIVQLTNELESLKVASAKQVEDMAQKHTSEVERLKRMHDGEKETMKEEILEMTTQIAEYQRIEESRNNFVDDVMLSRDADE